MTASTLPLELAPGEQVSPVVTVARSALRTALGKLMSVVDTSRATLPVARHLLLEAVGGRLILSATNFSEFVRVSIPCDNVGTGTVFLPARVVNDIVSALPATGAVTLTFNREGLGAVIAAGRSRFEVHGLNPDEFPGYPDLRSSGTVQVQASVFIDALERAFSHTSTAESRPIFNSIMVERTDDALKVVACEGPTLAVLPGGTIAGEDGFKRTPLIHRDGVAVLKRIFADLKEDALLTLSSDGSRLRADAGEDTCQVRLVEGTFPPYGGLLTDDWTHAIVCDRQALADAIRRVVITTDDRRAIILTLADELAITAAHAEIGKASDWVSLETHDRLDSADPSLAICMNATQLSTALQTLRGERVALQFKTAENAVFLRNADQAATDPTVILIMPLRFNV